MTLSDSLPKFKGHGATIDAIGVLCAQLTRDLFAIAKFLFELNGASFILLYPLRLLCPILICFHHVEICLAMPL